MRRLALELAIADAEFRLAQLLASARPPHARGEGWRTDLLRSKLHELRHLLDNLERGRETARAWPH